MATRIQSPYRQIFALIVLILVGVGLLFFLTDGFDLETLFGATSPAPFWLFFAAMAVLPVFGFPIAVFYLYAGAAYGPNPGIPLCLGALAVNMSASFLIATRLLREPITRWLADRGRAVPRLSPLNRFRFVFLMRTFPGPPFPVQNYLLALAGVPFPLYFLLSLLLQGIIASGMIWVGDTLWNTSSPVVWAAAAFGALILAGGRLWFAFIRPRKGVAKLGGLEQSIESDN
jgi:uncharacterized membrane protein YdjX (TVP38/TMEM64 family)